MKLAARSTMQFVRNRIAARPDHPVSTNTSFSLRSRINPNQQFTYMASAAEERARLQRELDEERAKHRTTKEELRLMRNRQEILTQQVEIEEENITNRMIKRIEELKREKTDLAKQIEAEEEYLTNTLQKKLFQVL